MQHLLMSWLRPIGSDVQLRLLACNLVLGLVSCHVVDTDLLIASTHMRQQLGPFVRMVALSQRYMVPLPQWYMVHIGACMSVLQCFCLHFEAQQYLRHSSIEIPFSLFYGYLPAHDLVQDI